MHSLSARLFTAIMCLGRRQREKEGENASQFMKLFPPLRVNKMQAVFASREPILPSVEANSQGEQLIREQYAMCCRESMEK